MKRLFRSGRRGKRSEFPQSAEGSRRAANEDLHFQGKSICSAEPFLAKQCQRLRNLRTFPESTTLTVQLVVEIMSGETEWQESVLVESAHLRLTRIIAPTRRALISPLRERLLQAIRDFQVRAVKTISVWRSRRR
jgi:hypothetical protein